MEEKKISSAVIRRLPRYYRYLGELIESGVQRISSKELSARMKVTASQIRQDLNNFGGFGQQGYGYNVQYLYEEIGKILGIDRNHNMLIHLDAVLFRFMCKSSQNRRYELSINVFQKIRQVKSLPYFLTFSWQLVLTSSQL